MALFSPDSPLGLPEGSIRAIIALLIVGAAYGRMALGLPVDPELTAIATATAAGYLGLRSLSAGLGKSSSEGTSAQTVTFVMPVAPTPATEYAPIAIAPASNEPDPSAVVPHRSISGSM